VEWRVLVEALMRAVVIEVPGKPIENGEGMFLVVDQDLSRHSSRTLRMNRSA